MLIVLYFVVFCILVVYAAASIQRHLGRPMLPLLGLVVAASLLSWAAFGYPIDSGLLVAMLCGMLVGGSEIVSRYRDEPFSALFQNVYGAAYLAINAIIAASAYGLLAHFGDRILVGTKDDTVLRSVIAGFGSSLLMRSKFFNFKSAAGEDFNVGPDAVISVFLRSVDRGIDRVQSAARLKLTFAECRQIDRDAVPRAVQFFRAAIPSFQNLSDDEKKVLDSIITQLDQQADLDPLLKLMIIAFAVLNLTGRDNFTALMTDVRDYLRMRPHARPADAPDPAAGAP